MRGRVHTVELREVECRSLYSSGQFQLSRMGPTIMTVETVEYYELYQLQNTVSIKEKKTKVEKHYWTVRAIYFFAICLVNFQAIGSRRRSCFCSEGIQCLSRKNNVIFSETIGRGFQYSCCVVLYVYQTFLFLCAAVDTYV